MAQLADESALFRMRRKNAPVKALKPIKLQRYIIQYTIKSHQLQMAGNSVAPDLELAAAAYDDDGVMLNATVNLATLADPSSTTRRQSYRVEQELLVPVAAASIRFAVRDVNTDRIGAMEVGLPLKEESQTQSMATSATNSPQRN